MSTPVPSVRLVSHADDRDGLRRLYEEHANAVRDLLLRIRGPGPEVEDLLQDVFLVAHGRWPEVTRVASPRAWLCGVAIRRAASHRRRERLRRLFHAPAEPVDANTPASAFERREAAEQLYRLLDKLPEKQRTPFILFELEGATGEEIAEAMGCPLKTVWTRLYHARQRLTRIVEKERLRARGGKTP